MFCIVSTLDVVHNQQVSQLWTEMKNRFGIRGILQATPLPHFSYHVAETYELAVLQDKLRDLARDTAVFTVHCIGVGIFSGPQPVVYVPVARSPKLGRLHERLWQLIHPLSEGALDYYQPEVWFPHITLGNSDINGDNLGPIVQWLNAQELNWTVTVDNFCVLGAEQLPHQFQHRFPFAATAS